MTRTLLHRTLGVLRNIDDVIAESQKTGEKIFVYVERPAYDDGSRVVGMESFPLEEQTFGVKAYIFVGDQGEKKLTNIYTIPISGDINPDNITEDQYAGLYGNLFSMKKKFDENNINYVFFSPIDVHKSIFV